MSAGEEDEVEVSVSPGSAETSFAFFVNVTFVRIFFFLSLFSRRLRNESRLNNTTKLRILMRSSVGDVVIVYRKQD